MKFSINVIHHSRLIVFYLVQKHDPIFSAETVIYMKCKYISEFCPKDIFTDEYELADILKHESSDSVRCYGKIDSTN